MKKELRKAVTEYFKWQGDKKANPIKFVYNANGLKMLVVQFIDGKEQEEMSCLMMVQEWLDGHWDVTEFETCYRDDEEEMIKEFEKTGVLVNSEPCEEQDDEDE